MAISNEQWNGIAIVLLLFVVSFVGGLKTMQWASRCSAIEAGVAEWRCDPQTGVAEFVWLGNPKPEEGGDDGR